MPETPAQRKRRVQKERRDRAKAPREQQRRRSRRRDLLVRYGSSVAVLTLVAAVAVSLWWVTGRDRREAEARLGTVVVREANLGRDHVPSTSTAAAPTSGPHSGPAVCGVLHGPLGVDSQIHSLEHGSVLFQYRPDDVSSEDIDSLGRLAGEFGSHVTVAPNPSLAEPFVATAWTRRAEFAAVDLDRARDFAIAFRQRGPERVDCDV